MLGLSSSNKFDPDKDIPSLENKVFIVTGGTNGIGYGISAHILQHKPAKLYILGSSEETLCHAYAELKAFGDVTTIIEPIECNLLDLKQTDSVARKLAKELTRLDALVLNAGIGVGPYKFNEKDGIDSHMQINVIAQYHLMMILLPHLIATDDSRIVWQSSEFHHLNTDGIHYQNLEEMNQDVGATKLYGRTKLAQILLQRALLRRKNVSHLNLTPKKSPWLIATHPGGVSTGQPDQAVEAFGMMGKIGVKAARPFLKDPVDEGCKPALYAATSEEISSGEFDGAYIVPDKKATDVSKQAQDKELQEQCLRLVEGILKEKLEGAVDYQLASEGMSSFP